MNDKEKDLKEMREIIKATLEIQYESKKEMKEYKKEMKKRDKEYKEYKKEMEKRDKEYKEYKKEMKENDRKHKENIERINEEMKENDRKYREDMKRINEEMKEYKKEMKENDRKHKENMEKINEEMKENDRKHKENIERINEEMKENDRKYREDMKRINKEMGNTANSRGDILEYNIFTNLRHTMFLDNIRYDRIYTKLKVKNDEQEFDIVLENGKYIAIIEVKCQARIYDLESTAKLAEQYRKDFKEDANKEIRVYLAAAVFKDDVINESKRKSVKLLTIKNDIVQVLKSNNKKQ